MGIFSDLNEIKLIGNLTRGPEFKQTPNGYSVTTLNVVTNHDQKKGEEWVKTPTFHKVIVWGKLAELVNKFAQKGTKVMVEGRLEKRSYEKDGIKKTSAEVVANDVILLARLREKDQVTPNSTMPSTSDINPDDIPF